MSEPRKIKTLKDSDYFGKGTYKGQFKDYMTQIGLTNIIARTILAPIQRWRIIKQTQVAYPLRPLLFKNFIDYVQRVPKEQGISAFWRGNTAGIWLFLTQSVLQIGLYDSFKGLQKQILQQQQPGSFLSVITERLFIPLLATVCAQTITYPIDVARVRISMNFVKDKKHFPFHGIRTCLKHLRNQQNFKSMYKGFVISNAISLLNLNLYLAFAKAASSVNQGNNKFMNADVIGSVLALAIVHPLDTIKKIIQLNNMSSPHMFKNGRKVVQFMKQQTTWQSFYNGLSASMLRSLLFLPTFYLASQIISSSHKSIQD